jgi:hypothetical protein
MLFSPVGLVALITVAPDHCLSFVHEAFAVRDAGAQGLLVLFHLGSLTVPPGGAGLLIRDREFLSPASTILTFD